MEKNEKEYYLYKTVQEDNILPVTSKCNLSCIFCSHIQNPPEIETIQLGNLKLDKLKDLLDYLSPDEPIIIGESATKIIEGEPLIHPNLRDIIKEIRDRYKKTEIKITTNANYLDNELLYFFETIGNITLNISVNYIEPGLRKEVMGKNCQGDISSLLTKLKNTDIEYNFSMVALPQLYGYKKIKYEIEKMMEFNPLTIRVFMPGYTKLSTTNFQFEHNKVYKKLYQLVHKLNMNHSIPISMEPPLLIDLTKMVKGVIKNSPADQAGIKYLDIIETVNEKDIATRVEAFNMIKNSKDPRIKINRNGKLFEFKIQKRKNQRSGLLMDYDISLNRINSIKRIIQENMNKKTLFLTSELGYELINYIIKEYLNYKQDNIRIEKIKNTFLQGSIISAGLLTNIDVENHLLANTDYTPDKLILPAEMYDIFNNDLCGNSYKNLEEKHMFEVEIV